VALVPPPAFLTPEKEILLGGLPLPLPLPVAAVVAERPVVAGVAGLLILAFLTGFSLCPLPLLGRDEAAVSSVVLRFQVRGFLAAGELEASAWV
jgi:hypothetical protein